MSYFNTVGETNPELKEYRAKAMHQDDIVLSWFDENGSATPSEVWRAVLPDAPLTSVRRSITNLTNEGKLIKTSIHRQGIYGRQECVWKLPSDESQLELW